MITEVCCAIIGIHLATAHIDASKQLNDVNPGVYVQTTNNIVVGTYYNSLNKQSTYAGYVYKTPHIDFVVGGVTGYSTDILPMILPTAKLGPVRLMFLPKISVTGSNILHLSIEKEIK